MPYPARRFSPSLESNASVGEPAYRPSLFDTKDDFIERVSPIGVAAIYFGSFTFAPQDPALSRQALFKLSFVYRNLLQPAGLRIAVERHTAILSGRAGSPLLPVLGDILARQIDGIHEVRDAREPAPMPEGDAVALESARLLLATDQTLRTGLVLSLQEGRLVLEGETDSPAQRNWAEQLAGMAGLKLDSRLTIGTSAAPAGEGIQPPEVDDESLQAMVLFRLRLARETEHLPVRVRASRGVVMLQGRVRTEALRQRVENLTRSTLGLRELRSSLSVAP